MTDKRVFVLMTAYNRSKLTENTIRSILPHKKDGVILIVVDDSDSDPYNPSELNADVVWIKNRKWVSPVITYNKGLEYINKKYSPEYDDVLIIQNAEGYHYGDIISYAKENVTHENYISFACLSLPKTFCELEITDNRISGICDCHTAVTNDDETVVGWYNHQDYYPRALDFCCAISWGNMKKLNGFDERYAKHTWFGDDDFRNRVKKLGLKVTIGNEEMPFVCHQWHSRNHQPYGFTEEAMKLYNKTSAEDNYSGYHVITEDL